MSALLGETYVADTMPKEKSLAEHDKEKHPHGFNPETDTCKFRERIATETETDKADIENPAEEPKGSKTGSDTTKKALVTPEEDSAYMAAVENGDMETAANMVERIASIKFNTEKPLFHAGKLGSKNSNSYVIDAGSEGFHLGTLESATDRFLEVISELDDSGTIDSRATKQPNGQYRGEFVNESGKVLLETSKTYPTEHDAEWAVNVLLANKMKDENEAKKIIDGTGKFKLHKLVLRKDLRFKEDEDVAETDNPSWEKKIEEAKKEGYDGIVYKNAIEGKGTQSVVVWKGENVKTLDPVTYDNNGNVVPLSKRFDDGDDIRGDVSGNIKMLETLLAKRHPAMDAKKLVEKLAGLGSREAMEKEIKRLLGNS